jgi:DNA-directed RNA polymerase alpha subunit
MITGQFKNGDNYYPRILTEKHELNKLQCPNLSVRLLRITKKHGIRTAKQLLGLKTVTAQKWFGFGDKTIEELLEWKLEQRQKT